MTHPTSATDLKTFPSDGLATHMFGEGLSRSSFALEAYRITNARVPIDLCPELADHIGADRLVNCDIVVEGAEISMLRCSSGCALSTELPVVDFRGGIVLPRFVDVHTHLDKGHIWARSTNLNGTFAGARAAATADRDTYWSADDVRARMNFSIRCAVAHGSGALRTHLESVDKQTGISWPVFAEMREEWRDTITLQAAALFPVEIAVDDEPQFRNIVKTVVKYGGVLGGVTCLDEALGPKVELALDRLFEISTANSLDLDLHVDESLATNACSLERIAVAAIRNRFGGRIVVGHCCSLSVATDEERTRVINLVCDSGIAVVSLPMCNMYLQDRNAGRTPRLRGVAPVHELDEAGVPVMIGSDNTRDPYYPYGDLDMLEVFREATRILHLDHSNRPWLRMLGISAAEVMDLPNCGRIVVGQPAHLVLTRARTVYELLCRPQSERIVLVAGRAIDTIPPDYRELDHLIIGA